MNASMQDLLHSICVIMPNMKITTCDGSTGVQVGMGRGYLGVLKGGLVGVGELVQGGLDVA